MSKDITKVTEFDSSTVEENRKNGFLDLNDQRKAFCITYITNGFKHRQAATQVGYEAGMGIRLKREPLVAAYINVLQNQYFAESIVTKAMMDSRLDQLEAIAMGEEAINMVTAMGDSITVKKFHPEMAMKVYQERNRLHEITKEEGGNSAVSVTINMAGMVGESPVIAKVEREDE